MDYAVEACSKLGWVASKLMGLPDTPPHHEGPSPQAQVKVKGPVITKSYTEAWGLYSDKALRKLVYNFIYNFELLT